MSVTEKAAGCSGTLFQKKQLALAVGLITALGANQALAAEEEKQEKVELDTVVVEGDWLGTPTPEDVKVYPGARSVVDSERLHESGALHLEDAMRSVPGVTVLDETGTGILPNIGVRGLNPLRSQRVQVLVDGYPIATGPYTNVGVSLFPVTHASLEKVDIVRGGAAVHYGPNNVGGVLNFHTRLIPVEAEQTVQERVTMAEESGNIFTDTYYRAGGYLSDNLGVQLQANIQRGDGFREHSETEVNNLILDAQYFINDQHDLAAQIQYYDVDAELPGALSPEAYEEDRTQSQRPHDAYEADMLRGTLTWTYVPNADTEFQWRNFAHDADRTFFFGQRLGTDDGSHWADPALPSTHVADSPRLFKVYGSELRVTTRMGGHWTRTSGVRYVKEEVDFDVNREVLATGTRSVARDWHFDTEAVALYDSHTFSFFDDRFEVTPGLRYESVRTDFTNNADNSTDENDTDELLPGLTVGLQAADSLFLFANGQRSLVPVQTAQVTKEGDVANELSWNYELGARLQPSEAVMLSVTGFRIDFEDQVQYNSDTSRFENLGETRHQGVEFASQWQATQNLTFGLGYTYLDTEQRAGDHEGNDVPNAPRHKGSAELLYNSQQWEASLTGVYVSESFSDAANTEEETANGSAGELPDYTVVNARIGRNFALGGNNKLNLALSVNNALDEDYFFRGADVSPVGRVPAPGRSFTLEGRLDF